MIETGLYDLLVNEPTISALIVDRVYPILIPPTPTFPLLTYQLMPGASTPTLDTPGLQKIRIQIDCWMDGLSPFPAMTLRAAVTKFLAGLSCALSDGTWANFTLIGPNDFYSGGDEAFRCMVEFYCTFVFPAS